MMCVVPGEQATPKFAKCDRGKAQVHMVKLIVSEKPILLGRQDWPLGEAVQSVFRPFRRHDRMWPFGILPDIRGNIVCSLAADSV